MNRFLQNNFAAYTPRECHFRAWWHLSSKLTWKIHMRPSLEQRTIYSFKKYFGKYFTQFGCCFKTIQTPSSNKIRLRQKLKACFLGVKSTFSPPEYHVTGHEVKIFTTLYVKKDQYKQTQKCF